MISPCDSVYSGCRKQSVDSNLGQSNRAMPGEREEKALGGLENKQVLNEHWATEDAAWVSVPPLEIKKDGVSISVFTVTSTFRTAQDGTADELRIESMFPADESTERLFRDAVGH